MNIFNYILDRNPFPDNEYMKAILKDDFCFLDIETTGFSRKNDQIVLIGLLFLENEQYKLRQYFLEDPLQEKELLKEFIKDFSNFKLMITYNGLSFDYPFIQERAKIHQLPLQMTNLKHIDLYKHIQRNKKTLPIENYQLKTVEKLLGIHRKDQISGGDSVTLYFRYLQNRDPRLRDQISLHNYEDIFYLPLITGVFNYFSEPPFLINSLHHSMNLMDTDNFDQQELTFVIKFNDLTLKDHKLTLKGLTKTIGDFQEINIFEEQFNFCWSPENEQYHLELLVRSEFLSPQTLIHYFNYKEVFSSIESLSSINRDKESDVVDDNFIMSINHVFNYSSVLKIMPEILKKIYKQYLSKK